VSIQTYRTLSEKILTTYYRGTKSDDSTFTQRHVAQLISEELSQFAHINAIENSNMGESTYSNDTFIVTYKNISVLTDTVLGVKYIPLPAMPTALPSNQEVEKVWPVGAKKVTIIPMNNRSKFAQDMLPPLRGIILYYIENGNIVFDNPTMFDFPAVNVNLIGAMPAGELLDQPVLMPKNYEAKLSTDVIARLLQTANKPRDIINDAQQLTA
jgi:hypothetical protein